MSDARVSSAAVMSCAAALAFALVRRARAQCWRMRPCGRAEYGRIGVVAEPLPRSDASVHALSTLADVRAAAIQYAETFVPRSTLLARSFVPTPGSATTTSKPATLRFLQFNMLARGLSSGPRFGGFTKTPRACLDFHAYRKLRVLEEMLRFGPDVVAVEECDHFHDFLQPAMDQFGYDGVYQPKRDAPGLGIWREKMSESDRRGKQPFFSDGCALFWKRSTLRGVMSGAIGYDSGQEAEGVLWGQVGLYARLELVENGAGGSGDGCKSFVVAATHLKSKPSPENEARRVAQISQLFACLEDVRRDEAEPVVVMGDFNTDPGLDLYKHVTGDGGRALDLDSAYALGSSNGTEPAYTTCKERKTGVACHTIDYILVPRSTAVEALLSVPPLEDLSPGLLPNWDYPSDHLAIGADLALAL